MTHGTALYLLQRCLKAEAMTSSDAVTVYLDDLIERQLCDARGIRLVAHDVVLAPKTFRDHTGTVHTDLEVPVHIKFDSGRASRGYFNMKNGYGIVEVNTAQYAGNAYTNIGDVRRIPRESSHFVTCKSTLIHELTHALDVFCGIPRFIAKDERIKIPGETHEQYRHRYHTSGVESRAFSRQLLHILSIKLEAKLVRMGGMARAKKEDIADRFTLLHGSPAELLQTAAKLHIMPEKLTAWVSTLKSPNAPVEILQNLYMDLAQLQALLRKKYSQAVYHGA